MLGSTFLLHIYGTIMKQKIVPRIHMRNSKYVVQVFTTPWVFFSIAKSYIPSTYIRYKVALLQGLWNCLSLQREVLIGVDIYIIGIEPLLNT